MLSFIARQMSRCESTFIFRTTQWRSRSSWSDRGDTLRNRCLVEPWLSRSTPPCPTSRWRNCSNSSRRCRNHVTPTIRSGSVNIRLRPTSRTPDTDASVGNVHKIMWCKDYNIGSRLQRAPGYNEISVSESLTSMLKSSVTSRSFKHPMQ